MAQLMGLLFDADAHIPNLAFDEFLKCFSKSGIMEAGAALKLLPRNTGKEMRTAIMAHVGSEGRWVPTQAGFGPAAGNWKEKLAAMISRDEKMASLRADNNGEVDEVYPDIPGAMDDNATDGADAGEGTDLEGQDYETVALKDVLLEKAGEVLVSDDADPDARATAKAHLDSHLEVVLIAA